MRALFAGGPWHGELHEVPGGERHVSVPHPRPPLWHLGEGGPGEAAAEVSTYTLVKYRYTTVRGTARTTVRVIMFALVPDDLRNAQDAYEVCHYREGAVPGSSEITGG